MSPIRAFTSPISVFTCVRSRCSHASDFRVHVDAISAQPPVHVPSSPMRPWRDRLPYGLGFAPRQQARHMHQPNRIHSRCGPTLHLQLLPTAPRGDAVSFGFRPEGTGLGGPASPDDAPLQGNRPTWHALARGRAKAVGSGSWHESDSRGRGGRGRCHGGEVVA
jgi:hypothetical protein